MPDRRERVPGTWHPRVDVNAIRWDSDPASGVEIADRQGAKKAISQEMGDLIRRLEMCWNCLAEFPASMNSTDRFSRWTEAMDRGQFRLGGPLTRALVLDRVLVRHCPLCAAPISDVVVDRMARPIRPDEESQA